MIYNRSGALNRVCVCVDTTFLNFAIFDSMGRLILPKWFQNGYSEFFLFRNLNQKTKSIFVCIPLVKMEVFFMRSILKMPEYTTFESLGTRTPN